MVSQIQTLFLDCIEAVIKWLKIVAEYYEQVEELGEYDPDLIP